MKKKKGFTLIELLAVIIILAAIALIIAPLVLDIIKEQQKKTFKESINGILRSSRLEIVNSGLSFPATFTYSNGKLLSPTGKELKVTGKIPDGSGNVRYNSEDDIDLAIHDNSFCGTYNKTSKEVDVDEFTGGCEIVLPTSEDCFEFDASTGTITEYLRDGGQCTGDVIIPETIDGVVVKVIGEESFYYRAMTSVVLSSGIKEIRDRAFKGGELDSYNSDSHNEGQLLTAKPGNYKMFFLRSYDGSYDSPNYITSVDLSKATKLEHIGNSAFSSNQLTSVEIPESVTSIGYSAFGYNQLTSVTIPNSVTSIGLGAFRNNQLTSVTIPFSVTSIEGSVFESNQLTSVTIPNSVTSIGYDAFSYNQLTSVTIPNSVTSIGNDAFAGNGLTSVEIPESVTSIGPGAFNDNRLPDDQAFIYARNNDGSINNTIVVSYGGLKRDNVIIPSMVTSIGDYAFTGNGLTSVMIPNSVTSIGEWSFSDNSLVNLTIPGNVINIGYSAFCSNRLTSLIIEDGVASIGSSAFSNNQLTSVTIPASVMNIGLEVFRNNHLTSVTIKGKSSKSDFTSYGSRYYSPFSDGWADGYSDSNIIWNG